MPGVFRGGSMGTTKGCRPACIFAPLTVFSRYIRAGAGEAREAPLLKMILEKTGHFIESDRKLI
jgi:hypothetical protein